MKITISASLEFTWEIKKAAEELTKMWHEVIIPHTAQKIISGEISYDNFVQTKEQQWDTSFREDAGEDLLKKHVHLVMESDAIFAMNITKKNIPNYIWWGVFLEMAFAYVSDKKVFLLNPIPDMMYRDELVAMHPTIINGDLSKIQ